MINRVYGADTIGNFALTKRDGITLVDGKVLGKAAVAMLHKDDRSNQCPQ